MAGVSEVITSFSSSNVKDSRPKRRNLIKQLDSADFSDAATGAYAAGGMNYKYITFTGNGTLTVTRAGFADVLMVAGGGGGTNGGGGAGGYLEKELFLNIGTYTITIGAGGAGRAINGGLSDSGNRTLFYRVAGDGFVRNGGGGGNTGQGAAGASAGGSYNVSGNVGNVWEGNDSGSSVASGGGAASGGGGAGAASSVVTGTIGGNGGAGISSFITGTTTGRAGGGGGISAINPADHGLGVDGGGNVGSNGTANTGGGGGASNGAGGSGIVIVRVRIN